VRQRAVGRVSSRTSPGTARQWRRPDLGRLRHVGGGGHELVVGRGVLGRLGVDGRLERLHVRDEGGRHRAFGQMRVGAGEEGVEVGAVAVQLLLGVLLGRRVALGRRRGVLDEEADVLAPQGEELVARGLAVDRADGVGQFHRVGVESRGGHLEVAARQRHAGRDPGQVDVLLELGGEGGPEGRTRPVRRPRDRLLLGDGPGQHGRRHRHVVGCLLELGELRGVVCGLGVDGRLQCLHVREQFLGHGALGQIGVGAGEEGVEVGAVAVQLLLGVLLGRRVALGRRRGVVDEEADVLAPQGEELVARGLAVDRADGVGQGHRVLVQGGRGHLEVAARQRHRRRRARQEDVLLEQGGEAGSKLGGGRVGGGRGAGGSVRRAHVVHGRRGRRRVDRGRTALAGTTPGGDGGHDGQHACQADETARHVAPCVGSGFGGNAGLYDAKRSSG